MLITIKVVKINESRFRGHVLKRNYRSIYKHCLAKFSWFDNSISKGAYKQRDKPRHDVVRIFVEDDNELDEEIFESLFARNIPKSSNIADTVDGKNLEN